MFYVIEPEVDYLEVKDINYEELGCRTCHQHQRVGPIHVAIEHKMDALPVIQPFDRLAFSEYLIGVLVKGGITGWEALPDKVKVSWKGKGAKPKLPTYHEIIVTGRAGHISQYPDIIAENECPSCDHKTYTVPKEGFKVREDLWDGSNLFWIEQFPGFLADEKFVEFTRAKKIRGFEFVPTEEWRDSEQWMEEDQTPKPGPGKPEYTFDIVAELRKRRAEKG